MTDLVNLVVDLVSMFPIQMAYDMAYDVGGAGIDRRDDKFGQIAFCMILVQFSDVITHTTSS